MKKLEQMTKHIVNSMIAHTLNETYFDYQDSARAAKAFNAFVLKYVKPAVNEAARQFLIDQTTKAEQTRQQKTWMQL